MSVLVYSELSEGKFKKTAFEAVSYGSKIAEMLGTNCVTVAIGNANAAELAGLGKYGASKVLHANSDALSAFSSKAYAKVIAAAAEAEDSKVVVLTHNSSGKTLAGRIAVRLDAALVAGATALPSVEGDAFTVLKSVYSGKAFAEFSLDADRKVLSLNANSYRLDEREGTAEVVDFDAGVDASDVDVEVVSRDQTSNGQVPLPEAELVVSAGRGMKGPEHWTIVEELAQALGATTACSRPVADSGWRPHHEHVGQTGVAIKPNLYIAIGISGAIQHLAGVNQSKTIVVINKDSEAPFFKAADYGIIGDAFDVIPRLTAAVNKFKNGA